MASRWISGTSAIETFAALVEYCRRVASAVGLICLEIFGYRNPRAMAYAENLGLALQLTNIIRDVDADHPSAAASTCRREDLERFGVIGGRPAVGTA